MKALHVHANDESNKIKKSKSVTFSNVYIREYPICLGDNPAVHKGPPLSIAWEYHIRDTVSLEDYETARRPNRRSKEQLLLSSFVREHMLRSSGYSRRDIQKEVKKVNIARHRRRRCNVNSETAQELHKAQKVAERWFRGMLHAIMVRRRNNKKEEETREGTTGQTPHITTFDGNLKLKSPIEE